MALPEVGSGGFRRGARLGVDWGKARVGVAACDAEGLLAFPVETVPTREALQRVTVLARELGVIEVVLGWPLALDGRARQAAEQMAAVARNLAAHLDVPLRVIDERLTTTVAQRYLTSLDHRAQRLVIDQLAAAGILEDALAFERHTGVPPGQIFGDATWEEAS